MKENKITNCHSEEALATEESFNRFFAFAQNDGESGRSMVEMLGVIAVMGVLSVAGIAGYNSAMNRHRANEILNEASKRAVLVAAQAMTGKTGEISLSEFGNNTVSGVSFGANATIENNQITLTLSGDGLSDVCPQMITYAGDNSAMLIEEGCGKITFNADMSKGVVSIPTSTPVDCSTNANACSGCQTCQDGVCKDNNASCPDNGTCTNGRCSDCPKGDACETLCCVDGTYCATSPLNSGTNYTCHPITGGNCTKNSDCNNGNSEGDKYCKIERENSALQGTCMTTDNNDLTSVSYNGKTFYAGPNMNWWSAENFCLAHGKKLPSLGSLGLPIGYNGCSACTEEICILDPMAEMMGMCYEYETDTECMKRECSYKSGYVGPVYAAFNSAGIESGIFWTSSFAPMGEARYFSFSSSRESTGSSMRTTVNIRVLCE